jgi:hypothetical protein
MLGSYLAGFMFANLVLALFAFDRAFFDATARQEDPENFALLPYSLPACIAIGCAIGFAWARTASPGDRWRRIVAAGWVGFIVGSLPISILLVFMVAYVLVMGFLPGLLAGSIWGAAVTGLALAQHQPGSNSENFQRSVRRLSAALMLFIGPVALFVGWELPIGEGATAAITLDLVAADFAGDIVAFYTLIGVCSAVVAWLLSPLLTRWYIRESQVDASPDSVTGSPPDTPLDTMRVVGS